MDFFEHQERARKKTGQYLALFVFAVLLINIIIYFLAVFALSYAASSQHPPGEPAPSAQIALWNPSLFLMTSVSVTVLIGLGSLYKIHELSQGGGKTVAEMLGGHLLARHSSDPDERKLLNVVEEMAIASGIPIPDIYLLEDESINAFAAGNTISDCVVGVTRGCIQTLSRDELQGVVAHEFSHILNGDMKLNIRLMGLLNGILLIAMVGYLFFRFSGSMSRGSSSSRDKGGGMAVVLAVILLGVAIYIIGYVGIFFANMIKAAVSRQREFLADASAVQFTRNPEGIAGALKKIMTGGVGSRVASVHASEASHLFFSSSLTGFWSGLFATHPPLEDRIRAIAGANIQLDDKQASTLDAGVKSHAQPDSARLSSAGGLATNDSGLNAVLGVSMLSGSAPSHRGAMEQMAQSATAQSKHLDFAGGYMDALPAGILSATTNAFSARAVVIHLLLTGENYSTEGKDELLMGIVDAPLLAEFQSLESDFQTLKIDQRLPLLDLCIPSLKQLSPDQYKVFRTQIAQIIAADKQVDFLEFCLERTLLRHLDIFFKLIPPPRVELLSLDAASSECRILISCLAHVGGSGEAEINRAYAHGWKVLDVHDRYPILPLEQCSIASMDTALEKLSKLGPPLKKQFLLACTKTVLSNAQIDTFEAELVRAYADNLDTPLPPLATQT